MFNQILETARELFEHEGFTYVSTRRIAEKADISIGSLYQYFPNCESIALAIYEESSSKAAFDMRQTAAEITRLPVEESIPRIMASLVEIFQRDQFVLLQLIDEVPDLRTIAQPIAFDILIQRATKTYLEQYYPNISQEEIANKAYIMNKSIVGSIRRYLEEQPESLSQEKFIEEITLLAQSYLATLKNQKHQLA